MPVYDLIENAENAQMPNQGGGGYKFNPLIYPKLILKPNTPVYITFLTDWRRGLKLNLHFNEKAKRMDLCDKFNGKKECEVCTKSEEWSKANSKKPKEQRGQNPFGTTQMRVFLVYDHGRVGQKVLNDDGSVKYEEEPIVIYEQRPGEGAENFVILQDANGDPFEYYDDMGEDASPRYDLQPDRLKNCELMYDRTDDKIWSVSKTVSDKGKTSYGPPVAVTVKQVRSKLGAEATLKVPKFVRDHMDQQNLTDLIPFLMAHYGNVDKEAWEITDPVEGQKLETVKPAEVNL